MNNSCKEIKYDGDVLTDITSFSMVQNILDGGQKKINRSQIETLDSIIQLLIFYDNVWIVEPFIYGGDIETSSQEFLNILMKENVVNQSPQKGSDSEANFISQFEDIQKIISPQTFDEYYETHQTIASDLQIYEENFCFTKNIKAKKLADLVNLDHKLIPLCANFLRTNFYFKLVHQMKKEGRIITYSPNVMRTSLVDDIIKHQNKELFNNINLILREKINLIALSEKERRRYLAQRTYCNFELELPLPLLTAIVLDQCTTKDDFIDQILMLRKNHRAKKIRKWLKRFQTDISNNKREKIEKGLDELDQFSKSIGAKSTNKANLVTCFTDPALLEASAASVITGNPLPAAAGAVLTMGKNWGIPFLNSLFNNNLILLFEMSKKAKKVSFDKDKFEQLFNVKLQL